MEHEHEEHEQAQAQAKARAQAQNPGRWTRNCRHPWPVTYDRDAARDNMGDTRRVTSAYCLDRFEVCRRVGERIGKAWGQDGHG